MTGHDDSWKTGKFRAVVQWGFSWWQEIWGEHGVDWRKRYFPSAGMNESTQTRQWECCCKVVLSVVGNKLMSFCLQNEEFLNAKVALGIIWISSALGTYLSQWFMNGVRKMFLPTVLFRDLFLWVTSGTWLSWLLLPAVFLEQHHPTLTECPQKRYQRGRKMSVFEPSL